MQRSSGRRGAANPVVRYDPNVPSVRDVDEYVSNAVASAIASREVHRVVRAIMFFDQPLAEHCLRCSAMAAEVGKEMGLRDSVESLRLLGALHDIGKEWIPGVIRRKPDALTPGEWRIIHTHTEVGKVAMEPMEAKLGKPVLDGVLYHHENYNGMGYPRGLRGEEIPVQARIIRVVDSYDAMTSDREYQLARPPREAVLELVKRAGEEFDPNVVEAFIRVLRRGVIVPFPRENGVAPLPPAIRLDRDEAEVVKDAISRTPAEIEKHRKFIDALK